MPNAFFSDLLSSIAERGRGLLRQKNWPSDSAGQANNLIDMCRALLTGRGEATGVAIAAEVLGRYRTLEAEARRGFFSALERDFGPDHEKLEKAIGNWKAAPDDRTAADLHYASEPRRLELFRRLNRAPGGTAALVDMRADLLSEMRANKTLAPIDKDFTHLFASWFNRGFLVLRRIDWSTPASILERIIRYEAVHEIHDWDDLRRRIDPPDRRCYAFFHPALTDEPLIFVEVALAEQIPGAIAPLLAHDRAPVAPERARTAVFYSISNCQKGLAGVTFGNFLIKQVVEELRRELPRMETFVTLSPVPGFRAWLANAEDAPIDPEALPLVASLDDPSWTSEPEQAERLRKIVEPLAAHYFLKARLPDGRVVDPVARFHLGNGARLERINWMGDLSRKGLKESGGVMVNYLYDLDEIEKNHEAFANQGEVMASSAVKRMLKGERQIFGIPAPSFAQG
ncbi:MAG: malonyl-CoA decarboxylase [Methylobacteriaceae bacterium]|nr:malonyl-CoA decarboxylase [Methylobacteriaceae bacterium]